MVSSLVSARVHAGGRICAVAGVVAAIIPLLTLSVDPTLVCTYICKQGTKK